MNFMGLEIIINDNLFEERTTEIPTRRSKKKRVQKKFIKKYGFIKEVDHKFILTNNKAICHSSTFRLLNKKMK